MTDLSPTLGEVAGIVETLSVPAPSTLRHRTLAAVGLADEYTTLDTSIGPVHIAWNGLGVSAVALADDASSFERQFAERFGRPIALGALPDRLAVGVRRRLAGDMSAELRVDLRGRSEFERAVWEKTLEIPAGEVRPYGWVAAEIGSPRAVRAVGSALGRNPVPLVIPCHRVVRTDGTIGQYALGTGAKRAVLAAEGVDLDRLQGYAAAGVRYVGSDTTRIFCLPTCRDARRIGPRHERRFHSEGEAGAAGYRPCRHCRPVHVAA